MVPQDADEECWEEVEDIIGEYGAGKIGELVGTEVLQGEVAADGHAEEVVGF